MSDLIVWVIRTAGITALLFLGSLVLAYAFCERIWGTR